MIYLPLSVVVVMTDRWGEVDVDVDVEAQDLLALCVRLRHLQTHRTSSPLAST